MVVPYTYADVVQTLSNDVAPYDWKGFFPGAGV
jgi:hypothetical protein